VARTDDDLRDRSGVGEAHVLPLAAAVRGLVHAVAPERGARRILLTRADPDDVAVGRSHGDVTDRPIAERVGDRMPGYTGVRGLPHAAAGGAYVDRLAKWLWHCNGRNTSAVRGRPEIPERKLVDESCEQSPTGIFPAVVSCRGRLVSLPVGDGCRSTVSPRALLTGLGTACAPSGALMNITDASTATTVDAVSGLRFIVLRESVV